MRSQHLMDTNPIKFDRKPVLKGVCVPIEFLSLLLAEGWKQEPVLLTF